MSGEAPVLLLMGPTASGKSGLALALAQRLGGEIISVDSAQVYRGMDIGTAKPDAAERARVPHHLLDILDPAESYSAARFRIDALRLIDEVRARGRVPLLVGGTMLYFRALTAGLSELPSASPELRARLEAEGAKLGWPAMHARLTLHDPVIAARLHPNDQQRVQRALEIFELTGVAASQLQQAQAAQASTLKLLKLALEPPDRAELHRRIERRFLQMMEAGLLQEVQRLHRRGDLHPQLPAIRAVGYRQLWQHLDGILTLPEAVQQGIAATRQLAKRQLTWMRSEKNLHRLDSAAPDLIETVLKLSQKGGAQAAC